jgi:hypothetical protein
MRNSERVGDGAIEDAGLALSKSAACALRRLGMAALGSGCFQAIFWLRMSQIILNCAQ